MIGALITFLVVLGLIIGGMATVGVIFGAFFGDLQARPKTTAVALILMVAVLIAGALSLYLQPI